MTKDREEGVAAKLRDAIAHSGPLGLDRYMEICLTDPEFGYYTTGAPIGAPGDFITAPEISQIFGELIGLWLVQSWLDRGAPDPFVLVELGPGRGVLMADILRAARLAPQFLRAARVRLIETSGPLRAEQADRLAACEGLGAPVEWRDRLSEVEAAPVFLVANEFFDALPARQWLRRGGAWFERFVGRQGDGFGFVESDEATQPDVPPVASAPDGAILETSAASCAIASEIGVRIAQQGGAALIIDYGYTDVLRAGELGWRSTFQAVYRHARVSPFERPGQADLTTLVAFDDLARSATGAVAAGPINQGAFLLRLGAAERMAALAKAEPARAATHAEALARLTEPDQMGALFKVLALAAAGSPALAAFE